MRVVVVTDQACAGGGFQPNRIAQPYFPAEISNTFSGVFPEKCCRSEDPVKGRTDKRALFFFAKTLDASPKTA